MDFDDKYYRYPKDEAMYTACFTKQKDSYLMWKAYSNDASGCSIGFNTDSVAQDLRFINVIYSGPVKKKVVDSLILLLNRASSDHIRFDSYLDFIISNLRFLFKSNNFRTECEVRLLIDPIKSTHEKTNVFPHIEVPFNNSKQYGTYKKTSNHNSRRRVSPRRRAYLSARARRQNRNPDGTFAKGFRKNPPAHRKHPVPVRRRHGPLFSFGLHKPGCGITSHKDDARRSDSQNPFRRPVKRPYENGL